MTKFISYPVWVLLTFLFSNIASAQLTTTWYRDYDGDGYGSHTVTSASKATGYVKNNLDWKDTGIINTSCWEQVGTLGFTAGNISSVRMAVGGKGTAYIAFVDPANSNKVTCYKKAEGDAAWSILGTAGFSASAQYCKIAADSKDSVYVMVYESSAGKLNTYMYRSSAWTAIASSVTINSSNQAGDIITGLSDTLWLACGSNGGSSHPQYRKYQRGSPGSWTAATNISATNYNANEYQLAMDNSGNPWLAMRRTDAGAGNAAVVYQYSAGTWTQVGAGNATVSKVDSIALIVDTSGIPYLSGRDANYSGKGAVRRYASGAWKYAGIDSFFSVGNIGKADMGLNNQTNQIYIAFSDSSAQSKKVQVRKFNTSSSIWEVLADSTISEAGGYNVSMDVTNGIPYVVYRDVNQSNKMSSKRYGPSRTWSGATNGVWTTASNWYGNDAPSTVAGEAVTFDKSATTEPTTPSGTTNLKSIYIQSTDTLTVASGSILAVTGDVTDSGLTKGAGKIQLAGTVAQTITGTGTFNNLELNNAAGATIASGSTINITDTYTPTAGALTVSGTFVLRSVQSLDAHIAPGSSSGNYIIGTVTAERWDTGRRAFRYFGHPFKNSIKLSQLEDPTVVSGIDITGPGSSANGFTYSGSGNPSAFYYDVNNGTGSTTSDPGWTAFTKANVALWQRYQGAKILVRGIKGEGLTTTNYTPSNSIFRFSDTLNEGDQTIPLTKLSAKSYGWNLIGNPFPAKLNMVTLTAPVNANATYYVWNARAQGANGKGGYTNYAFGVDNYTLPAYGAFFVNFNTVGQTNTSMSIPESCKTGGTDTIMFKTTTQPPAVIRLAINDSNGYFWDQLEVILDSTATDTLDNKDGMKVLNSDLSFYTLVSDTQNLSIDTRPYADSGVIKLGIAAFTKRNYIMSVPLLTLHTGDFVYLIDSYTHTSTLLQDTTKYLFTISTDTLSYGKQRFSLLFHTAPDTTDTTSSVAHIRPNKINAELYPNPATTDVTVTITMEQAQQTSLTVLNALGQQLMHKELGVMRSGWANIPLQQLNTGVYFIEIKSGSDKITRQLVKE